MRRTGIHLELLHHRVTERALGQHALDGLFERTARVAGLQISELGGTNAAGIAGVRVVDLVVGFVSGDPDLGCIDDDDEVARDERLVEYRSS